MQKIKNKKAIFLAYDVGFLNGPFDLTEETADPSQMILFADKESFDGISLMPGIFYQSKSLLKTKKVSTIVKVNGITSLSFKENIKYAPLVSSLDNIVKDSLTGAIGFNLYLGTKKEPQSLKDLSQVIFTAAKYFKKVFVWPQVFASSTFWHHNETLRFAYGVRAAMEIGADAAVIPWPETRYHFDIIAKMAPNFSIFLSEVTFDNIEKQEEALTIIKDFFAEGGRGIFLSPKAIDLFGKGEFVKKIKHIKNL